MQPPQPPPLAPRPPQHPPQSQSQPPTPAHQSRRCLETADNNPRAGYHWVRGKDKERHTNGVTTLAPGPYAQDLNKGIAKLLSPQSHAGYTGRKTGISQDKLAAVLPLLDMELSSATLKARRTAIMKLPLQALWNSLWTAAREKHVKRPRHTRTGNTPTGQCPLCGAQDSVPHILGGCAYREGSKQVLKCMYISRHDQAVQAIADCIHHGRSGSGYMIADAGKAAVAQSYISGRVGRMSMWQAI